MNQQQKISKLWIGAGIALVLSLSPCVFAGTIYKWTDANGVTQFTEIPPTDRQYTQLTTNALPYVDPNAANTNTAGTPSTTTPATNSATTPAPATPPNPNAPQLVQPTPPVTGTPAVTGVEPAAGTTTPGTTAAPAAVAVQKASAVDCKKAQDEITILSTRSRIHDQSPGANNKIMTPQEQADRLAQLKAWVAAQC